jgi:lipoprotein-anchoring transpeptidase ErfK/SrfK
MMTSSFPFVNPVTPLAVGKGVKRSYFLILTMFLWSLPAIAELRLEVDLSDRALVAVEDGSEVARYAVAVGTKKYPTPQGTFHIRKIVWNPPWTPPDSPWARGKKPLPPGHPDNPMKRVKLFFSEPDYFIHGTDAEDSLGKAESHGCLRMSEDEATQLAQLVMDRGGNPMPEPWYRRIFHGRSTKVVVLKTPVEIEIGE